MGKKRLIAETGADVNNKPEPFVIVWMERRPYGKIFITSNALSMQLLGAKAPPGHDSVQWYKGCYSMWPLQDSGARLLHDSCYIAGLLQRPQSI